MATQEERISALEKDFATFRRETSANIQEIEENTTILLGVIRSQGRDIKRIFETLETMDNRLEKIENQLGDHRVLLTQILERLPNNNKG